MCRLDPWFKISHVKAYVFVDIYAIICNANCFFLSIAGKILESSKPEYATCRSLLRSGIASSLRVNIRAVSWKPSAIIAYSSIFPALSNSRTPFDVVEFEYSRFPFRTLLSNLLLNSVSYCCEAFYSILLKNILKRSLISEQLLLRSNSGNFNPSLFYIFVHALLT